MVYWGQTRANRPKKRGDRLEQRYGAFLRGVNVNGNKIKMDDLREAFRGMGFADAKTLLNTGNVAFSAGAGLSREALAVRIGQGLREALGYDAPVYLRSAEELAALVRAGAAVGAPEGCHLYALLCGDANVAAELGALFAELPRLPEERFLPADGSDAFWVVPKGSTLDSPFGSKALGAKRFRDRLTSRNMQTITKMAGLTQE